MKYLKPYKSKLKDAVIVHINDAMTWRGGEKQTFHLCRGLAERGLRSICVCRPNSELQVRLAQKGLPHYAINMRSEYDIIAAYKIAALAKKVKCSIMHSHTSHGHGLACLANKFFNAPANIVSRRVDFHISKNIFSKAKYNFPQRYLTVSGAIKDILIQDGIAEDKISVVYSGVDFGEYKNIECGSILSEFKSKIKGRRVLVNVAAMTEQKDHETLVRALDIVRRTRADFVCFIVGEGELKDKVMQLSETLGLSDNIIFTGYRKDALSFIKCCDVFVMPSFWEGLGTSIIDAMAMAKPVVATNAGGIPELIDDGKHGLLAPVKNPQELADMILKMLGNKSLQKKLSAAAQSKARMFDVENTITNTIGEYERLFEI